MSGKPTPPSCGGQAEGGYRHGRERRGLAGGEDAALGGRVAGHGRDFVEVEAGDEHGIGGDAAPAVQLAFGTDEFHFLAKSEVENDFGCAAIKLLRELQERLFAEILIVGGTPDGDVERFLLDLVGNFQYAKESARSAGRNVEGSAIGVRFESGFPRDE